MNPDTMQHINKSKVCELCRKHDPLVKNYAEDFELQTALRHYLQKSTGDRVNVSDIAHLCDSCYEMVRSSHEESRQL